MEGSIINPDHENQDIDKWLRNQSELAQDQVIVMREAMCVAPVLYFGTWRTTHSDVISLVTTTKTCVNTGKKWNRGARRIQVPLKDPKYTSPLREPAEAERTEHARKNQALWLEEELFISKLDERRRQREECETNAATIIQRSLRGYLMRLYFIKERKRLIAKARLKKSYKSMSQRIRLQREMEENLRRAQTKKADGATKIQAVVRRFFAMRAAAKEKITLCEEVLNFTATSVQCLVRKRFARRHVANVRMRWYLGERNHAVTIIQRVFRGVMHSQHAKQRRLLLQVIAASMIQRPYRRYLSLKFVKKELTVRRVMLTNDAAIALQAVFRGRMERRVVIAMRNQEKQELSHASALSIQAVFRGHLGRSIARKERHRMKIETEWCAAMLIERGIRGMLGRIAALDEMDSQQENIFVQARLGNLKAVDALLAGFNTSKIYDVQSMDPNGNTVLLIAAQWGWKKIVRKMLRVGMEINHVNDRGESAVQLAIRNGHADIGEYLVTKDAEIEFYGDTLLHRAAKSGFHGLTLALLARGIKVNEKNTNGQTPLHLAALKKREKVVRCLLDRGANVNAFDEEHNTPLHYAASVGADKIVLMIVESGADLSLQDALDHTPWRVALLNEHEETAMILRHAWSNMVGQQTKQLMNQALPEEAKAAAVLAAMHDDMGTVQEMIDVGAPIDVTDASTGNTILMGASMCGSKRIIEMCLRKGAKLGLQNLEGKTAIHFACVHPKIAKYLLKKGCSITVKDKMGRNACFDAAENNFMFFEATEQELNVQDNFGFTPLMLAMSKHNNRPFGEILQRGVRLDLQDSQGNSIAHHAASAEFYDYAADLCMVGDPDMLHLKNKDGNTPLHLACAAVSEHTVQLFLENGAVPNTENYKGETCVRICIEAASPRCLQIILAGGGDPALWDEEGVSPLRAALLNQANQCAEMIAKRGGGILDEVYRTNLVHDVCLAGNGEGVQILIDCVPPDQHDWIIHKPNFDSFTPFQCAVMVGCATAVQLLGAMGSSLDYISDDQERLLHLCCASENSSAEHGCISFLLDSGLDPNEQDVEGCTPLHRACSNNYVHYVEALVGATQPELVDHKGWSPFHYAAKANALDAMATLLYHGLIMETPAFDGKTPLEVAGHEAAEWIATKQSEYESYGQYIWEE